MSLNEQLPEVDFLKGLLGFLRYAEPVLETQAARMSAGMHVAQLSLMEYAKRCQADEEPDTKALAFEFSGILQFARAQDDSSGLLDAAYQLVPYNADGMSGSPILVA